ncbi:hypothetical protein O0L34_g4899 [Tuta absoluta]|nr:hypothetical protein O0L34_g4899 [Tuta absoluta]
MTTGCRIHFLFLTIICFIHVSSNIITSSVSTVIDTLENALHFSLSQCIFPEEVCGLIDIFRDVVETGPSLIEDITKLEKTDFLEKFKAGQKNEDKDLPITQLIAKYGYKIQKFTVETEDGYMLALYRIPGKGDPVLLVHGLTNSAVDWFTVGKESALPTLLADRGYDVWIISCRGTTAESQRYLSLTLPKDAYQYWDFSWDEIGRYDLPATIDFILSETGKLQLRYVGFSQGTTSFYVMASERPEYAKKISLMVALAPVAWFSNIKSPLLKPLGPLLQNYAGIIRNVIGFNMLNASNPLIQLVTDKVCGTSALAEIVCASSQFAIFGFDYAQVNATQAPVIYGHYPSSIASKQSIHYAQIYNSGKFRRYDYGPDQNKALYGSEQLPDYPVEKISTPVALFYSRANDWVSAYEDVLILKSKLRNVVDFYNIPYATWAHFDYLWAKDVKVLAYNRVLELFQKY